MESAASRPKNQQAYDLYLRSVAVPHDPAPNKEAIKMLEWAVGIDSATHRRGKRWGNATTWIRCMAEAERPCSKDRIRRMSGL